MKSVASVAALIGVASAAYQPQGYWPANGNLSVSLTSPTAPNTVAPSSTWEPTVTAIVSSFTTVCPTPTTLTYNSKTYTVTDSTTLTITECPCTITTPVKSWTEPTVTAIVTSYETYCPGPTTFTAGTSTYTVTEATTVTVTNAGDCTIVTPIGSLPPSPTWTPVKPTWSYQKPSSTPQPSSSTPATTTYTKTWNATQPATTAYTTYTVSSFTTYCPYPTTVSHGTSTITVTTPTTITFTNCPCTITKPYVPASSYTVTTPETVYTTVSCPTSGTYTIGTVTTVVSQPTTLTATITSYKTSAVVTTQYLTKPAPSGSIVYPKPQTTYITTEISSIFTTYCPTETTIITQGKTYPVVGPTTVSIPIVSTSVYTSVKPAPPAPTVYQPAPPATTPAAPAQPPAVTGQVVSQISDGQVQVPTGSAPVQNAASATPSVQAYTGAAARVGSTGAGVIAMIAGALFF